MDKNNTEKHFPIIHGSKGKGSREPTIAPNSLFSTDILFVVLALGEGPLYRINPNGAQDIQIQDSDINDLVNLDTDGSPNSDKFFYVGATGTTSQKPLPYFGDEIITPQTFSSPVSLKKGNLPGVPPSSIELQETSANDWDSLRFNFLVDSLARGTKEGDIYPYSVTVNIKIYDYLGTEPPIVSESREIKGKADTALKASVQIPIPEDSISTNGYRFTITKESNDVDDSRVFDNIKIIGWDEIKNEKLAYPRTALLGMALKAVNEHQGGVPNFTSLIKGLLVKVPSNYNQPTLSNSEIDWRHLEVPETGDNGYTTNGYYLQFSDEIQYDANPNIYKGVWDGTFVYSWTQNPVWIMYDILTNNTYGLGIPEKNIDKYAFYKLAMYCDACDFATGNFIGVDGLSDGSFRNKPLGKFLTNVENQLGLPKGLAVKERRFICDLSISDQIKGIDILNEIAASIRSILVYSGGKITIASDMPDEYPAMIFNEKNIKKGSISVSGYKLSDVLTSVDASYIDPTNHFTREVLHIDVNEINNGSPLSEIDNKLSIDLKGVTRRSQAMRTAQYLLASSRYQKRSISFTTGTEALYLSPGDLISIATTGSGINYGYGGRIYNNSAVEESGDTYVFLEHFTSPAISESTITGNTYPLALRVTKQDTDKTDLYIVSNSDYLISDNTVANDNIKLKVLRKYNPLTKTFGDALDSFDSSSAPASGDLWSFGEIENVLDFYTSKAGRLFKVKELRRNENEEVSISAIEYIPEVYTDSDSFINYEPTSYVDTINYLEIPPIPKFTIATKPRTRLDGSIAVDARMTSSTPVDKFYVDFNTEYEIANPEDYVLLNNITPTSPLTIHFDNNSNFENGKTVTIEGKNGFSTNIGSIPLLCTAIDTSVVGKITFTIAGLNTVIDTNYDDMHVLEVNDGIFPGVPKGSDAVVIPIVEKSTEAGILNFIGYADNKRLVSRTITSYDLDNNKITIDNPTTGAVRLSQKLLPPPFYVNLSQVLEAEYYYDNSFYVEGFKDTYVQTGTFISDTIELPVVPRRKAFTRLYVDGIKINTNNYTLNTNEGVMAPNIVYTGTGTEYRTEIDYYAPPIIEIGDLLEDDNGDTYTVASTTYDITDPSYNGTLTINSIFRIQTLESPTSQLTGQRFVNITRNPEGTLSDVTSTTATLNYSTRTYPGLLNLANSRIYHLALNSDFEPFVPDSDSIIKDLPLGTTAIRARNKNLLGRTSAYSQKSITVTPIPIQRVQNVSLIESLYREQNSGVSSRITVEFDHIQGQEVTDYEVSFKISGTEGLGNQDGVINYNTVKLPASGVDSDGKMRFTINNVDRGAAEQRNEITVKITPLNKSIRGITYTTSKIINGKETLPQNITSFTGGQQTDQITLFWQYARNTESGQLADLDLKEVVIRRIPGVVEATGDNFILAQPLVTVSAGTARKSIPIDTFGTFTYLAKTRDTSDNFSDSVVGVTLTTTRPQRSTTIRAYNEDDPSTDFSGITNTNAGESNFPSYADSTTGGLAYDPDNPEYGSAVDNANGTSTGFTALAGDVTDLLADDNAVYITQIRDVGTTVVGTITIDIESTQAIQSTYNDQKEIELSGVSETSADPTVFIDTDFGGIGHYLGYGNTDITQKRYDANNRTWMTGPANGNVWAIWNPGLFDNDTSNANSYALIAGLIDSTSIKLGNTYYANGDPTGSNALANLTTYPGKYQLVNLKQFSDLGTQTYQGTLGTVASTTEVRTATDDIYYANGNVDVSKFSGGTVNEGFIPYEAGSKTFRYFQIKHSVINTDPDNYDLIIDKFRYTVDKEQTLTTDTVTYDSAPKTITYTDRNYLTRPVVSYAVLEQIDAESNPAIAVSTAVSNTSLSFKLFASDGSGEYNANSTATVMVTIIGV